MKQHRYQRQSGVALVEFTLIAPLLLILIFITTEFGRAYYQYNTITKSVREAVRYLSVRSAGVDEDKATNIIVYGNPGGTGSRIFAGLSKSNVSIPARATVGSYPIMNTVTITV
ncbi:MAG TPA: TadE/TadG family type IV pilus assembly protein, partial [Telluria sp.]